jgi:hypothetical protein
MLKNHLACVLAAGLTCSMSAASTAWAQQPPGTNAPTPSPAEPEEGTTTSVPLREPVIDTRTERSSVPNTPLLVTGLVVLGTSYGASAVAAGVYDQEWDEQLYYPVAGPWMALNERDCDVEPCQNEALGTTLLVGSGVLQGLGALSMALSLFIPEKTTQSWYLIGNKDVTIAPLAGTREIGAFAVGRF